MAALSSTSRKHIRLKRKEFKLLGEFIQSKFGIKMPDHKIIMLESRLRRRLKSLNLETYKEYCDYLFSLKGMKEELLHMIDEVTTNKTDFFRENEQFKCLYKSILPDLLNKNNNHVSIWSAACSTGEEPYTLAMLMDMFLKKNPYQLFEYFIHATDISVKALNKATMGIFNENKISSIPDEFKKNYLLRSKDKNLGLVRIVPELRQKISFRYLNLMDDNYLLGSMNIIFCRNVIIYFAKDTQISLLNRMCRHLKPGGYIFMGHSEVLAGFELPLEKIKPTIYRKIE